MKTKRNLFRICRLAAALLALPAEAQAQYIFTTNNDTITITGYTGTSRAMVIPGSINGYPVTSIGNEAFVNEGITNVSIPNSVTSIGEDAFDGCTNLASVNLPNSVTNLEAAAFEACSSLTSITIPEGVTTFDFATFAGCTSLTNVTMPSSVTNLGLPHLTGLGRIQPEGVFAGCTSLTSVTIPSGMDFIGVNAFGGCTNLTSLYFQGNAPSVDSFGFSVDSTMAYYVPGTTGWSTNLGSLATTPIFNYTTNDGAITITASPNAFGALTIPGTILGRPVTSLDEDAFAGSGLTSVTVPNSVTNLGEYAFVYCTRLTSVTIGTNVTSVGDGMFEGCASLTNVISPSVTSLGAEVFLFCQSLKSVTIPNGVTNIGDYAFEDCTSLGAVYFQGNAPGIDAYTFLGDSAIAYYMPGTTGWSTNLGSLATSPLFNYTTNDGAITITLGLGAVESLTIPSAIFGVPVTSIGDAAFSDYSSLTSLTIPNGITSIGNDTFGSCAGLASVTIPNSVTSIGPNAFFGCGSLTNVMLGSGVTVIGGEAFGNCTALSAINVNPSNIVFVSPNGVLLNQDETILIQYPTGNNATSYTIPNSVISIGDFAFDGCASLASITIPDSVTSIGNEAFESCAGLTSIAIPDSVSTIGVAAFDACSHLGNVIMGSSVTSVGDSAFANCGLTSITIPDNVTSLGNGVCSYCTSLTNAIIGNGVASIGENAFGGCNDLTSVTIANSVTTIGNEAFAGCQSLASIAIPRSVITIGDEAFADCGLTSVTIGSSVTNLEDDAFAECGSLSSVNFRGNNPGGDSTVFYLDNMATVYYLPGTMGWSNTFCGRPAVLWIQPYYYSTNNGTVTIVASTNIFGLDGNFNILGSVSIPSTINGLPVAGIGAYAFDASVLTGIIIPNSVTTIGEFAFAGQNFLTSVTLGTNVTTIGTAAFNRSGLTNLTIPGSVINIGETAFANCPALNAINVNTNNPAFSSLNGVLFNKNQTVLIQYPTGNSATSYTMPNSVTNIGDAAFENCFNLGEVIIGANVLGIGDEAFDSCGVTNITIPNTVTSIGDNAFASCGLTSIMIPSSVSSIGNTAFENCGSLGGFSVSASNAVYSSLAGVLFNHSQTTLIQFPLGNGASSYAIPGSVTSIADYAFAGCALTNLIIPNSVTSVGDHAFDNSPDLTYVQIGTSVSSLGDDAFANCSYQISFYFQGSAPSTGANVFANDFFAVGFYVPGTTGWGAQLGGLTTFPIFTYTNGNGGAIITGSQENNFPWAFSIPATIFGQPVTGIGSAAFQGNGALTSVTISSGVITIGAGAFADCANVTAINVNSNNSVYGSLNGVLFNKNLTTLIQYPAGNSATSYTIPKSVSSIGDFAFDGCASLTSVVIGTNVTNMGQYAFNDCGLTSVVLPSSVTSISSGTFNNCASLTSVVIGTNVTSIGDYAFADCGLTNVVVPGSVTNIGMEAFGNCTNLASVALPNSVTSTGDGVFDTCSSLTAINIPSSLGSIANGFLDACYNLPYVTIPSGITNLGFNSFEACTSLVNLSMPNSVTSIGENAFENCSGLTSIVISTNLSSLVDDAFFGCTSLGGITIPRSVTNINEQAFQNCFNLTSMYFPGNAPSLSELSTNFGANAGLIIYYQTGATGWSNRFDGLPTVKLGAGKPTLAITAPGNGQRWSNSVFIVTGTASDSVPLSGVWFEVNSNSLQLASTTNQWTNWTATASLQPGTNVVQAYAMDVFDEISTNASVNLTYVATNVLLVRTIGAGTVSPNYSNALLQIGQNYTMTATPGTGFVFTNWIISTNWIGGVTTNHPTVQFTMASNLTLQATFAETSNPTLTISAPTAGQHMTNALANVVGTAGDNWQVSSVWYQLKNGAWNLASTTNGWTNWTATVELVAGSNTVNAYAMNLAGNYSATNSVSVLSSNSFELQFSVGTKALATNGFTFSLQLATNLNGHIEYSTNLISWNTLTNFAGTSSTITIHDPAGTNSVRRFYRAVIP